ncbi:flagellar hook-associated protein FlgK [Frigidibacter sp. SD6-1]|uniref:flagellar hook-associated protein FlgK n=1 Tax=Frigidibacter sp. SD6-1 TaxID=3032581 RepID=UPI0024DFC96A|nr:flagellar hook-associated protein FlgK [Frigidibacter sp. SD6-1]
MGLTTTLANALSGLNAASRGADVVSQNISNARTPGYARRELNLSALSLGGQGAGVWIDGVSRSLNQSLLTDRRLADADVAAAGTRTSFLTAAEQALGQPGDAGSLGGLYAAFDAALVQAASRPDSQARLQAVVDAANDLATKFNGLTDMLQQARMDADDAIATQVDELNKLLIQTDELNADILAARASGRDATALMDQRQGLVDRISQIVPVREVARDHDQIALYTTGGAILLEGNPATVGFSPVGVITADMTLASSALSGLSVNGQPVPSGPTGVLGGGSLGAQFSVRDELAPEIQMQIDALARDLMERFEAPGVDPTLAPGQPGLFTDAGLPFDPLIEEGLAGRIRLNTLVDPSQGGALWHLRDGLGAVAPGQVGDATLLNSLRDAFAAPRIPASGPFIGAGRSAGGLAADVLSQVASNRQNAEAREAYTTARQTSLTDLQLKDGVDTDAELQNLLLIEQAFSANARVIQTVDDLINKLIGL